MRNVPSQRLHLVLSLTVVAALAGCGGSEKGPPSTAQGTAPSASGDQRGILATVDALQSASREGNGATICGEIFTPRLVKSVEAAAKRSCAKEVGERFTPDTEISIGRDIELTEGRGTAFVREQNGNSSRLSLVKRSGQWRIDRVTPQ